VRSATERVLVLYEHSRAGAAVIDVGRELAEQSNAALTVVAVAPQAPSGPRCGNSAVEFNEVVVDSVARDLDKARRDLGPAAERARFVLLIEDAEPSLAQFAREGAFDVILLPAHRRLLRSGRYHPQAARLRLTAGAEIRIVEPASRQQSRRPVGAAG
jgi:nucleotide-binding universal stress UspA family protein